MRDMYIDHQVTGHRYSYDHFKITMLIAEVSIHLARNAKVACVIFELPTIVHHINTSQKVTV